MGSGIKKRVSSSFAAFEIVVGGQIVEKKGSAMVIGAAENGSDYVCCAGTCSLRRS